MNDERWTGREVKRMKSGAMRGFGGWKVGRLEGLEDGRNRKLR